MKTPKKITLNMSIGITQEILKKRMSGLDSMVYTLLTADTYPSLLDDETYNHVEIQKTHFTKAIDYLDQIKKTGIVTLEQKMLLVYCKDKLSSNFRAQFMLDQIINFESATNDNNNNNNLKLKGSF